MNAIPTDFDQLAHAIALATVRSDIEVYAARVTVDGHEYWDTTRPRHGSEKPDEDLAYLQRAMSYIDKAGDVFTWRMLRHIAAPGLVRFVERDEKTADDGACYCQQGVVCPACERAVSPSTPVATLVNPHTGALRDYRDIESDPAGMLCIAPGETLKVAPAAAQATAPVASVQILIEWLFRRFGAPIDAGELPEAVVTAVREVEHWLNPQLPMPEAPR